MFGKLNNMFAKNPNKWHICPNKVCMQVFTVFLFVIPNAWKQPRSPSGRWYKAAWESQVIASHLVAEEDLLLAC